MSEFNKLKIRAFQIITLNGLINSSTKGDKPFYLYYFLVKKLTRISE